MEQWLFNDSYFLGDHKQLKHHPINVQSTFLSQRKATNNKHVNKIWETVSRSERNSHFSGEDFQGVFSHTHPERSRSFLSKETAFKNQNLAKIMHIMRQVSASTQGGGQLRGVFLEFPFCLCAGHRSARTYRIRWNGRGCVDVKSWPSPFDASMLASSSK